jgi:hypothetical protein
MLLVSLPPQKFARPPYYVVLKKRPLGGLRLHDTRAVFQKNLPFGSEVSERWEADACEQTSEGNAIILFLINNEVNGLAVTRFTCIQQITCSDLGLSSGCRDVFLISLYFSRLMSRLNF